MKTIGEGVRIEEERDGRALRKGNGEKWRGERGRDKNPIDGLIICIAFLQST